MPPLSAPIEVNKMKALSERINSIFQKTKRVLNIFVSLQIHFLMIHMESLFPFILIIVYIVLFIDQWLSTDSFIKKTV